jgi:hypothetical protein
MGGKIIHSVKYADYFVLLVLQETVLNGAFDRINKIAICYGRDKNL